MVVLPANTLKRQLLTPPNCPYVNARYLIPTSESEPVLILRIRWKRRGRETDGMQDIDIAVGVLFYLKAARKRSERMRAHTSTTTL